MPFLDGFERRSVRIKEPLGLDIQGLILGQGAQPLEVLFAHSLHRPSAADLKTIWKARHGGRAAPVLLVVLYGEKAALCGPSGDPPPVFADLDPSRVERICCVALEAPDRHAALRFLHQALPEVESAIPGLRNEGLFATHELECGVKIRPDWTQSVERARALLNRRGRQLLESLGFAIEPLPGPASVLRAAKTKIAIAVLLERHESPDISNPRFSQLSPVSYAMTKAEEENLPFVYVVSDSMIRLHPVRQNVGVGRRGRTETFIELNLNLLEDANSGLLPLIFSADALQKNGAFDQILENSRRFAGDLGVRLRERIHSRVIPPLAEALIQARALKNPSADDLAQTYEMALVGLFRILFVAYAEDKDLLPYRGNELYRARSLKQKSCDLVKIMETGGFGAEATHWDDVHRICQAIVNRHLKVYQFWESKSVPPDGVERAYAGKVDTFIGTPCVPCGNCGFCAIPQGGSCNGPGGIAEKHPSGHELHLLPPVLLSIFHNNCPIQSSAMSKSGAVRIATVYQRRLTRHLRKLENRSRRPALP